MDGQKDIKTVYPPQTQFGGGGGGYNEMVLFLNSVTHPKYADGLANSLWLIRMLLKEQSGLGLLCLLKSIFHNI